MFKFLLRICANALALYIAVTLMTTHGIEPIQSGWVAYLLLGLIFGIINAILRPLLTFLTCPLIILTLGLGTLLINALLFWLTGIIGANFGIGFIVTGFWPAFLGALIVSVVSFILNLFLRDHPHRSEN